MKVVILAGGMGTRLAEETGLRPKPMVEIGGRPILWHIMSIYASYGFNEFVIAAGYKAEMIKEYFANMYLHHADVRIDMSTGKVELLNAKAPNWKIEVLDTGLHTMTGGRVKRAAAWTNGEPFMVTYGDGVGNIDVAKLVKFHKSHGKLSTLTATRPPARFGGISFAGDQVTSFTEKPQVGEGWINGGFMVLEPGVVDYIEDDATIFERGPMEKLAKAGQMCAYKHDGFWQPMDTIREKQLLDELYTSGKAPWKTW